MAGTVTITAVQLSVIFPILSHRFVCSAPHYDRQTIAVASNRLIDYHTTANRLAAVRNIHRPPTR